MAHLTPQQRRRRARVEGLIRAVAPALDLVLAAGDRLSRVVSPRDTEQHPVRPAPEPALLEPPRTGSAAARDGGSE
jgi:hypothetical protein